MATTKWIDEFLAVNPACERILLRVLAEELINQVQATMNVDCGPSVEHRCYELLNLELSAQLARTADAAPTSSGAPYRESAGESATLTCVRCGQTIAASQSNMTERGAVCDRCFAGG